MSFVVKRGIYFSSCVVFVILFTVHSVASVKKCYSCQSDKSLEDCELRQNIDLGCSDLKNHTSLCYIVEKTQIDGTKSFGKHCIAHSRCQRDSFCRPDTPECNVYCCSEPLCNRNKGAAVNVRPSLQLIILLYIGVFLLHYYL